MFMLPALFVMLVTSILSGRTILIFLLAGLVITGLMLATLVIGPEVKGATRWLMIGLRMQPSEFIKPILAVFRLAVRLWREQVIFRLGMGLHGGWGSGGHFDPTAGCWHDRRCCSDLWFSDVSGGLAITAYPAGLALAAAGFWLTLFGSCTGS